MRKSRIGHALGAIAAAALMTGAAVASGRYESVSVRVADLDLSNPAGVEELSYRINGAVNRICSGASGSDRRDCEDEAWYSTEQQVARAVSNDEWMRRLADERVAQLRYCERGCPLAYAMAVNTLPPPQGEVVVWEGEEYPDGAH